MQHPPFARPYACRYKEGGPAAEARFEAGVAGSEARAFRGCGIFTSEPFEVSDYDADSVQMLTRSSRIGEFYAAAPPQVEPENPEHVCDLLIYDEESDRHVRITGRTRSRRAASASSTPTATFRPTPPTWTRARRGRRPQRGDVAPDQGHEQRQDP